MVNQSVSRAGSTLTGSFVGVASIFCAFINFLIYAQFGFVQKLEALGLDFQVRQGMLGIMGAAGLATSFLAPRWARSWSSLALLRLGFSLSTLAVGVAIFAEARPLLYALSAALGVSVTLNCLGFFVLIRHAFGGRHIGLKAGLAVGLAYMACASSPLFNASPEIKGAVACALPAIGLLATFALSPRDEAWPGRAAPRGATPWRSFAVVTTMLLALIWLDSVAFYTIQFTPRLRAGSWGDPTVLPQIAVMHLLTGLLGGWMLDRVRTQWVMIVAYSTIGVGILLIEGDNANPRLGALCYALAVSFYSTVLCACVAKDPDVTDLQTARSRVGILMAIAVWAGSAVGVGMAQSLDSVSKGFVAVAGALVAVSFAWFTSSRRTADLGGPSPLSARPPRTTSGVADG